MNPGDQEAFLRGIGERISKADPRKEWRGQVELVMPSLAGELQMSEADVFFFLMTELDNLARAGGGG